MTKAHLHMAAGGMGAFNDCAYVKGKTGNEEMYSVYPNTKNAAFKKYIGAEAKYIDQNLMGGGGVRGGKTWADTHKVPPNNGCSNGGGM